MNLQLFAAVPAWMSTLALLFCIAVPAMLWQAFERTGKAARIRGARTASAWLGVLFLVWVGLAVLLSLRGFFEADPSARIPNLLVALLPLLAGLVLWPAWRGFRETVLAARPDWMIRLQHYRIVGILYLAGWHYGLMPAVFSIPAGFGDCLVGFSAPWVAWMVARQRPGAAFAGRFWNIFGLVDIATGVTLGALTAPSPFQLLAKDAPDVAITTFPLVLLPTILVPLSLLCHIYSLRVGTGTVQARYKTV